MQVKDVIMYHYHKIGIFDDRWKVGNDIIIDEGFTSFYGKILQDFSTSVYCNPDNYLESFDSVLDYYLQDENIEKNR